jgi:hypothetical protein
MLTPPAAAVGREAAASWARAPAPAAAEARGLGLGLGGGEGPLGVEDLGRDRGGGDIPEADRGEQVVDVADLRDQRDVVLEARAVDAEATKLALERLLALHDRRLAALQAKPLADLLRAPEVTT